MVRPDRAIELMKIYRFSIAYNTVQTRHCRLIIMSWFDRSDFSPHQFLRTKVRTIKPLYCSTKNF
ncbi:MULTISPECIES: hypothetical protein, partial [unclassified Microcoleus]|uniref:hypothetical protein n=1 Tax=unclassified Microcoleus TaxID=2642155 RepID=UPI0025FEAE5E